MPGPDWSVGTEPEPRKLRALSDLLLGPDWSVELNLNLRSSERLPLSRSRLIFLNTEARYIYLFFSTGGDRFMPMAVIHLLKEPC